VVAGRTVWVRGGSSAQRGGPPRSAASRRPLAAAGVATLEVRRRFVLEVPDEETADGLAQLPATRPFIERRLGPTALLIAEDGVDEFLRRGRALGVAAGPGPGGFPARPGRGQETRRAPGRRPPGAAR